MEEKKKDYYKETFNSTNNLNNENSNSINAKFRNENSNESWNISATQILHITHIQMKTLRFQKKIH